MLPGKFKTPGEAGRTKAEALSEMTASLLKLDSEQIEVVPATREGKRGVLSDEDLEMLLDRSEEVFSGRGQGWSAGGGVARTDVEEAAEGGVGGKKTAFAVYEAPVAQANEWVAKIMGEDVSQ